VPIDKDPYSSSYQKRPDCQLQAAVQMNPRIALQKSANAKLRCYCSPPKKSINSPAQISEYKISLLLLTSKRISIGVVCKDVISKAAFCNTLPLLLSKPIRLGVVLSAVIRKMTALDKMAFIAPLLLRCYCCPNKSANAPPSLLSKQTRECRNCSATLPPKLREEDGVPYCPSQTRFAVIVWSCARPWSSLSLFRLVAPPLLTGAGIMDTSRV